MGTYSNLTRIQKCNRDLRSSSHDMKTSRDDDFSQMLSKDAHKHWDPITKRKTDWHSIPRWPLALRAIKKIAQMVLPETSLFSRWRCDDGSFPFSGLAMNGFTYPFDASLAVKETLYFVLKNEAFVGSGKLVKWKRSLKMFTIWRDFSELLQSRKSNVFGELAMMRLGCVILIAMLRKIIDLYRSW